MIFNPADSQRLNLVGFRNPTQILPDSLLNILRNPRVAVLRAEHEMKMKSGVGVGHLDFLGKGAVTQPSLRDGVAFHRPYPALKGRATFICRSAALA